MRLAPSEVKVWKLELIDEDRESCLGVEYQDTLPFVWSGWLRGIRRIWPIGKGRRVAEFRVSDEWLDAALSNGYDFTLFDSDVDGHSILDTCVQSTMVCIPLGNLLLRQGDADGARAAYSRGVQLGDANSHFNLACLLAYEGDSDSAIDHIRRGALEGDQLAADVLNELASLGRRHVLLRLAELAMPSA